MMWKVCSAGLVYDRQEGQVVYFDMASGDTHLLDNLAAKVLDLLADAELSLGSIVNSCSHFFKDGSLADQERLIENILFELQSLDLVEAQ